MIAKSESDIKNSHARTALVTGATSGIGQAAALALADQGYQVIVHGRDAARGAETVKAIEHRGGQARFVGGDLSESADVAGLADPLGVGGAFHGIRAGYRRRQVAARSQLRQPGVHCAAPSNKAPMSVFPACSDALFGGVSPEFVMKIWVPLIAALVGESRPLEASSTILVRPFG